MGRFPWALLLGLVQAVSWTPASLAQEAADSARAGEILRATGVRAGLCVQLGAGDGRLAGELSRAGKFRVHVLDSDSDTVERARAFLQSAGRYGPASVERHPLTRLPYADNLVNLLVAEDPPAGISTEEILRVLCPEGAAFLGKRGVVRKPRAEGLGEWNHYLNQPEGNKVLKDSGVGIPNHLRWIAEPTWGRSHALKGMQPVCMVTAAGRLLYVFDEAPVSVVGPARLVLIARDAYNGLLLWKKPLDPKFGGSPALHGYGVKEGYVGFPPRALAARGSRLYTVLQVGGPPVAIDAATGEVVLTYSAESPREILRVGDTLIVVGKKSTAALEVETGKLKWVKEGGFTDVVVGEGKVYGHSGSVVALDLATGKEVWRSTLAKAPPVCLTQPGILVLRALLGGRVEVLSTRDGKSLWSYSYSPAAVRAREAYFVGGLIWVFAGVADAKDDPDKEGEGEGEGNAYEAIGLDPLTGLVKKKIAWKQKVGHPRCYENRATERFILLGQSCIDFVDWSASKVTHFKGARGSCQFGILPSYGLIYAPPTACVCRVQEHVRGFLALGDSPIPEASGERLDTGPAYGKVFSVAAAAEDWPTYRHDFSRSGASPVEVPSDLRLLWERKIGGSATAPVVAGGRVFAACPETHQVVALEAPTGREAWRVTAGGPVDTPPTIDGGRALFGSADGWVTCVSAAEGKLAWRFRAAPAERRIVAFGRVESSWPVHGSVLVREGTAYFAAGRASALDGGIRVYAAEAATGKVLWERQPKDPVLSDLLSGGNNFLALRRTFLDYRTGEPAVTPTGRTVTSRGGLLEPSWPSRAWWSGGGAEGDLLAFDAERVFGVWAFVNDRKNGMTVPGKGEYGLFCKGKYGKAIWGVRVPLRIQAMVLAGRTLFAAGEPDVPHGDAPWAAFDGKAGGELLAFSAADGKPLGTVKLGSLPVYDGMAAAGGKLYLSTRDGKVLCFGAR